MLIYFALFSQLVWATSNRIGCAINVCYNMNVWGMIWAKAVYLVCNYSPPYVVYLIVYIVVSLHNMSERALPSMLKGGSREILHFESVICEPFLNKTSTTLLL